MTAELWPLYILEGRQPVRCSSYSEWVDWTERHNLKVKVSTAGGSLILTYFIGIYPGLFETNVFGPHGEDVVATANTWEGALRAHDHVVWKVRRRYLYESRN